MNKKELKQCLKADFNPTFKDISTKHITLAAGTAVVKSFTEPGITIAGVPAQKLSDLE